MTVTSRMHFQLAAVVLIVTGIAVANWVLLPAKASSWMIAIGTAIGMGLIVTLMGRGRSFEDYSASERSFLMASVYAAGAVLAVSLLRHTANAIGFGGGEPLDRAIGVGAGLVVLLLGNTMPKILGPLTARRCAPVKVLSLQRFAGWVFVLDGLICIAASLLLPVERGRDVSMIATAIALVLVLLRYAWAFLASSARSSPTSG